MAFLLLHNYTDFIDKDLTNLKAMVHKIKIKNYEQHQI